MEALFAAILDLAPNTRNSPAAQHGQNLHSITLSMPGLVSNHISREDRLRIYWEINIEVTRDAQTVFFCLICEHFVVGRTCFTHHTKFCLRGHQHRSDPRPHRAPVFWRWLNCGSCFSQEVLARRFENIPHVSHVLHWFRFALALIQRAVRRAPWKCSSRTPINALPQVIEVLDFL